MDIQADIQILLLLLLFDWCYIKVMFNKRSKPSCERTKKLLNILKTTIYPEKLNYDAKPFLGRLVTLRLLTLRVDPALLD